MAKSAERTKQSSSPAMVGSLKDWLQRQRSTKSQPNQNRRLSTDMEERREAGLRMKSDNQSQKLATETEQQRKVRLLKSGE